MAETGWILGGNAVNDSTAGDTAWDDPLNATVGNDDSFAVASSIPKNNGTSQFLNVTGFSFGIPPGSLIDGVAIRIRKSNGTTWIKDHTLQLIIEGARSGNNHADTTADWPSNLPSPGNVDYGGESDLWGLTLTQSQVAQSGFGFSFRATNTNTQGGQSGRVYSAWMNIHFTEPKGNTGAFFALFTVKDRLREILTPRPEFWLPEPGFA